MYDPAIPVVKAISVATSGTTSTFTVSPSLGTGPKFIQLVIQENLIPTGTNTVSITDGTNTYTVENHRGDNLRCDSLTRWAQRFAHGNVPLRAYIGADPAHCIVFDRVPKSAYVTAAAASASTSTSSTSTSGTGTGTTT